MNIYAAAIVLLFAASNTFCQTASSSSHLEGKQAEPPRVVHQAVDLSNGRALLGLPSFTVVGFPLHCSSSNSIYVDIYADAVSPGIDLFPALYSISALGDVKFLNRAAPQNYKTVTLRDFFPGEGSLVSLIEASGKIDPTIANAQSKKRDFFISISETDGGSPHLMALDLKFEPLKVAGLSSGKFLLLGFDPANLIPVLALLDRDGSLVRILDLDNRQYDQSKELKSAYAGNSSEASSASRTLQRVLASASFVPYGSKVLLVQPGSSLPVPVLSDSGEERSIAVSTPPGFLVESILAAGAGESLVVRVQSLDSFQEFAKKHVIENPVQQLTLVDSSTGKIQKIFDIKGPQPGEVVCGAGKRFNSIYYDSAPNSSAPNSAPTQDRMFWSSALQ